MRTRYVVDTNILIAASAADPLHPKEIDATPKDPEIRQKVWEWLSTFDSSAARLVLDGDGGILKEYNRKLTNQDFGIQVVIDKLSKSTVDYVVVEYDEDGNGRLPKRLISVIHDRADRKMVAAALAAHAEFGEGCVAFAGDTDWHDWEDELERNDVLLEPVIEEWSRSKHAAKKRR